MQHIEDKGQSLLEFIRTAPLEKLQELLVGADFSKLCAAAPAEPRLKHSYTLSLPAPENVSQETFAVAYSTALTPELAGKTEEMPLAA